MRILTLVRVTEALEGLEELQVSLGGLDGDDIGIQVLDGLEDIVEVRVAEVGVDLDRVLDTRGRELERVDGPGQVGVPLGAAEGKTLTDSG
jgi:hypothetical protein